MEKEYKRYNGVSRVKGWGDHLADFTKATGIEKVVKTVTKHFGFEDCGCGERAGSLNNLEERIKNKLNKLK